MADADIKQAIQTTEIAIANVKLLQQALDRLTTDLTTANAGLVAEAAARVAADATKVDKVAGKGLSTEDYTTAEKTKLSNIEANAINQTTADGRYPLKSACQVVTFGMNLTPIARQAKIITVTGGTVIDAQARTAINAALVVLRAFGFIDPATT